MSRQALHITILSALVPIALSALFLLCGTSVYCLIRGYTLWNLQ